MADDELSKYEVSDDELSKYASPSWKPMADNSTIGAPETSTASRVLHAGVNSDFPYIHPIKAAEAATAPLQNYTQEGRAEHPTLSRIGDLAGRAEELGGIVGPEIGLLGAGGAKGLADAPAAAKYLDSSSIRNLWDALPQIGSKVGNAVSGKLPRVSIQKDWKIPGTPITLSRAPTALEEQRDLGAFMNKGYRSADGVPKKLPSSFTMTAEAPQMAPGIPRVPNGMPSVRFGPEAPQPKVDPGTFTALRPEPQAGIPRISSNMPSVRFGPEPPPAPKPQPGTFSAMRPEPQAGIPRVGGQSPLQELAARQGTEKATARSAIPSLKSPGIEGGEGRPATWNEARLWEFATRPGIAEEYKTAAIKQLEVRGLIKPNTPLTK